MIFMDIPLEWNLVLCQSDVGADVFRGGGGVSGEMSVSVGAIILRCTYQPYMSRVLPRDVDYQSGTSQPEQTARGNVVIIIIITLPGRV